MLRRSASESSQKVFFFFKFKLQNRILRMFYFTGGTLDCDF